MVEYKFNRLYNQVWNLVKKEIKDYFIFNEIKVKEITKKEYKQLENGEIDILVAPTAVNKEYIDKIIYSTPVYVSRPILVNSSINFNLKDYMNFVTFYISVWIKPFFILTSIILITGMIYYMVRNKKLDYELIGFSLGNISYINNHNNWFVLVMLILVIFTLHFIYAITAAFSVDYLNSYDGLNDSVENKKILVGDIGEDINLIKINKGIPIIIKKEDALKAGGIENYYFKNKHISDGCLLSYLTKKGENLITANKMKSSNYYFGSYFNAFALHKKNSFLLSKINSVIHKLKMYHVIQDYCLENDLPSSTVIC